MAVTATTAAILIAGSAAIGAVGSIAQGQAAAKQSSFAASVQKQQAEREREASKAEADDFERSQSRLAASRRAALGGSGVQSSTGSPLLVSEDFAAETELAKQRILSGGETRATRLDQQAELTRAAGRSRRNAGFISAGSSLLGGFGRSSLILSRPPAIT